MTLAEEDETFAIIPAAYGVEVISHLLDEFDTLALLKVKPLVDEVVDLLERRDLLATTVFVEKIGAPDERIVRDVSRPKGEKVNTRRSCWYRIETRARRIAPAAAAGSRRRLSNARCLKTHNRLR